MEVLQGLRGHEWGVGAPAHKRMLATPLHENWSLFCSIMDSTTINPFIYEDWMTCYVKWINIDLGL